MTGKEFMNALANISRLIETHPSLIEKLPPELRSEVE